MKNKKVLIFAILIISLLSIIFFINNMTKSSRKGNNIINKSADEIKEYILNIESYKATVEVKIKSNKNENHYKLLQTYNKENNIYMQEVIEPKNIEGVNFIYNGEDLKIENSRLNLSKIYKEYKYIESNQLSLISFIRDFKNSEENQINEEGEMVVLEVKLKNGNRYIRTKKLYINKEKGRVEKLEIKDITQNNKIYILYNEIEVNGF